MITLLSLILTYCIYSMETSISKSTSISSHRRHKTYNLSRQIYYLLEIDLPSRYIFQLGFEHLFSQMVSDDLLSQFFQIRKYLRKSKPRPTEINWYKAMFNDYTDEGFQSKMKNFIIAFEVRNINLNPDFDVHKLYTIFPSVSSHSNMPFINPAIIPKLATDLYNVWKPLIPKIVFKQYFFDLFNFTNDVDNLSEFIRNEYVLSDLPQDVSLKLHWLTFNGQVSNNGDGQMRQEDPIELILNKLQSFPKDQLTSLLEEEAKEENIESILSPLTNIYPWFTFSNNLEYFEKLIKLKSVLKIVIDIPEIIDVFNQVYTGEYRNFNELVTGVIYIVHLETMRVFLEYFESFEIHNYVEKCDRPTAKEIKRTYSSELFKMIGSMDTERALSRMGDDGKMVLLTEDDYFERFNTFFHHIDDDRLNALEIGIEINKYLNDIDRLNQLNILTIDILDNLKDLAPIFNTIDDVIVEIQNIVKSTFESNNLYRTGCLNQLFSNVYNMEMDRENLPKYFGGFKDEGDVMFNSLYIRMNILPIDNIDIYDIIGKSFEKMINISKIEYSSISNEMRHEFKEYLYASYPIDEEVHFNIAKFKIMSLMKQSIIGLLEKESQLAIIQSVRRSY